MELELSLQPVCSVARQVSSWVASAASSTGPAWHLPIAFLPVGGWLDGVHLGHAPCHPPGSGPLQAATAPRGTGWDWLGLAGASWHWLRAMLSRSGKVPGRSESAVTSTFWTWYSVSSVHALEPSVLAQLVPFPFLPGALSHAMPSLAAPTPLRATSPAGAPGSGIVSDSPPSRRAAQSASNPPASSPIQTRSKPSPNPVYSIIATSDGSVRREARTSADEPMPRAQPISPAAYQAIAAANGVGRDAACGLLGSL